jgi:hypothetical protein
MWSPHVVDPVVQGLEFLMSTKFHIANIINRSKVYHRLLPLSLFTTDRLQSRLWHARPECTPV